MPFSEAYGEPYPGAEGGAKQARHVYLAGNGLPQRWARRARFIILETGFGLGLNFLVTWQAWRQDPARCERLHFVSVENHPLAGPDLREAHARFPELAKEAAELRARWPMLVGGAHRIEFDGGKVVLTLFFGDSKLLRELRLAADAIYLDGFSPERHPEMWSAAMLRSISRLCASGATVATWSDSPAVRSSLEATHFSIATQPGYGAKKEMLTARASRGATARALPARKAAVVGAGLAGAAVCERLCARGWEVDLYERHSAPAQEASGNLAGTFHPIATPDDSVFARITRAGFLYSLSQWESLGQLRWDRCGVLQLARDARESRSQQRAAARLPAEFSQYVTREEASRHAGVPVTEGGLWFPAAGWIQPRSLVEAQLDACGSRLTRNFGVDVRHVPDAPVTILANSAEAATLHRVPQLRLRRVRGQLTYVPAERIEAPHVVVLRGGMVLPPVDGRCVVGASFDIGDEDPAPRVDSHAGNLDRLERMLSMRIEGDFDGRVAFRCVTPDRLPIAGKLAEGIYGAFAFGSRGLIWAALAAELIASELEGEPLPLEGSLVDALAAERFRRRAESRGLRP